MIADIGLLAAQATPFVKALVDVLKGSGVPSQFLPACAFVVGVLVAALLTLAGGAALGVASLSGVVLSGIVAGGAAIGVTELHNKVRPHDPPPPH